MVGRGRRDLRRSRSTPGVVTVLAACLASAALATAAWATTGATATRAAGGPLGVDDGAKLTMWTRSATQAESQLLVNAYNKTHKNHVTLTVVPTDSYIQKVGQAAGARQLPDLFASDVVYSTNFASKGLWMDITSRIKSLPFAPHLANAAIVAGTVGGKEYVVPHTIDTSILFYNKALYKKAGLDPSKPPTSLKQMAAQAAAITKYGHGNYGTYFGGDCPGCIGFTWWPSMWASGAKLLSPDGKSADFTAPGAKAVFAIYRKMYENGDVAPGAKTENGATAWSAFAKGNIGIASMPSSLLGTMPKNLQIGVAPLPGVNGGKSTFVGGDVLGISSNSSHADEAWNFIAWSLGADAQVKLLAKNHYQLARTDLGSNKYTSKDARLKVINSILKWGHTPVALNFGQTFNDPTGPWLKLMRDALFGDVSNLASDNKAISSSLAG